MRIIHLTTGANKQSAVYRLHKGLLRQGVESFIYTGLKSLNEKEIIFRKNDLKLKIMARIERQLLNYYPNREDTPWNIGFINNYVDRTIRDIDPDIIHLHWINHFVSIKNIAKFNKPIVWTMHDSWAFTGGCHIPYPCENFNTQCGKCPQLNSTRMHDLSNVLFNLKLKSWRGTNINIIGPSCWMCNCAASSSIFSSSPVVNIPNCIETDFYAPTGKAYARRKLELPLNKKIILFGANNAKNDKNKGFDLMLEAFNIMKKKFNDIELVVFGSSERKWNKIEKIREVGFITEPETFPLLYSAADVLVNASRSENFSNVILESLSCGTPVVAFDIGGNSDLICKVSYGRLVKPFETDDLAKKIGSVLYSDSELNFDRSDIINKFGEMICAQNHIEFYGSIIKKNPINT